MMMMMIMMPGSDLTSGGLQGCSLLRSKSCQADIEKLLDKEDAGGELIGDFTKVRFHKGAPACARRFDPQAMSSFCLSMLSIYNL